MECVDLGTPPQNCSPMLARDFDRLVVSHGANLETDAKDKPTAVVERWST